MAVSNSLGQQLLDVPMGDMIREMAFAIAEAQIKLDENSIEVAEMMGGLKSIENESTGEITFEDSRVFFGREQVPLSAAIALHASASSDPAFVAELTTLLGTNADAESDGGSGFQLINSGTDPLVSIPVRVSMLELGFTPTFYQFVDTIIEVRIAITITSEHSSELNVATTGKSVTKTKALRRTRRKLGRKSKNRTVSTTQVNASYASKYSYSAEGSSLLRTKLAPVPPPGILEERIRQILADETTQPPLPNS
jgi:hypothetical protein